MWLPAISFIVLNCLTTRSQAAVIVYWQQDGADVTASWEGTLNIAANLATDRLRTGNVDSDRVTDSGLQHSSPGANGFFNNRLGEETSTSISRIVTETPSLENTASFGFAFNFLLWNNIHITGGSVGAVSELTFNAGRDVIRFNNNNLARIGADSFMNDLAWQATTTNDTIRYTTVPEPSGLILSCVGLVSLLTRRRRS